MSTKESSPARPVPVWCTDCMSYTYVLCDIEHGHLPDCKRNEFRPKLHEDDAHVDEDHDESDLVDILDEMSKMFEAFEARLQEKINVVDQKIMIMDSRLDRMFSSLTGRRY